MTDASRISRYEQGWQHPSDAMAERILEAIVRLEAEGGGKASRAERARADYEAAEAETLGSGR